MRTLIPLILPPRMETDPFDEPDREFPLPCPIWETELGDELCPQVSL